MSQSNLRRPPMPRVHPDRHAARRTGRSPARPLRTDRPDILLRQVLAAAGENGGAAHRAAWWRLAERD